MTEIVTMKFNVKDALEFIPLPEDQAKAVLEKAEGWASYFTYRFFGTDKGFEAYLLLACMSYLSAEYLMAGWHYDCAKALHGELAQDEIQRRDPLLWQAVLHFVEKVGGWLEMGDGDTHFRVIQL